MIRHMLKSPQHMARLATQAPTLALSDNSAADYGIPYPANGQSPSPINLAINNEFVWGYPKLMKCLGQASIQVQHVNGILEFTRSPHNLHNGLANG